MTELEFAKEIILKKYPFRISLLVLNELIGTVLMVTGIGAVIPLLSALMDGKGAVPGIFGTAISYLGLADAKSSTILIFLISILFIRYILDAIRGYIAGGITVDISKTLRKNINHRITHMSWLDFMNSDQGKYIQCLTTESQLACAAVNDLASTVAYGVMLSTALIATLVLSPFVTIAIGVIGIMLVIGAKKLMALSHITSKERIIAATSLNNRTIDLRNMMKLIKAEGLEEQQKSVTDQIIDDIGSIENKQIIYGIGIDIYNSFFTLVIISLMSYLYLGLDFGNGSSLIFNLLLIQRAGSYFSNFQQKRRNMLQKIPSYIACKEIIENSDTPKNAISLFNSDAIPFKDKISLRDISFKFPNGTKALDNITIEFPQKGIIGVIGKSGSGKTTLIDILLGLISPDVGDIFIDDSILNSFSRTEWQNLLTYVPQNSYLMQGTIRDNLLLGIVNKPSDEIIFDALKLTNCEKIVLSLEEGLDTKISSGGLNFSGGERQRLCIARGLLRNSRIFVLDEPSASLDKNSEQELKKVLHDISSDKLIILITHSAEFIENLQKLYVINEGKCIWMGSHQDLLSQPDILACFLSNK